MRAGRGGRRETASPLPAARVQRARRPHRASRLRRRRAQGPAGQDGLRSRARGGEAGIYEADAAEVGGRRDLTYAAMSVVGQADLYLARSRTGSWDGPWDRLGCILDHPRVPCHNQIGTEDYEWGLGGPHCWSSPAEECC